jgi:hypothetical protein
MDRVLGATGPTDPSRSIETNLAAPTGPTGPAQVIPLAERAQEILNVTELEPYDGTFIGKHINLDGSISPYPRFLKYWRQNVALVPATIPQLFVYLREARERNICLIRGAPANLKRQWTQRQIAGVVGDSDRGNHGFTDEPSKLFFLDGDGIKIPWRSDPERAIQTVVTQLGEPWASTSFVWFFSATHGLEFDAQKRWTGKLNDGLMRIRFAFITERPLNECEATELTRIAQARIPELDTSISRLVQVNYIKRPHWVAHPDRDVLGGIPTIGWVKGGRDTLTVPANLAHQARWAKAQGHGNIIADHPDAESAVRGIGGDGRLREHMLAAVVHLLRANPISDVVSFADHSLNIADKLRGMIEWCRNIISNNLSQHGRHWSEVQNYLSGMPDWARWCLDHPGILHAKTIKLSKEERIEEPATPRWQIFARVAQRIEDAYCEALANKAPPPARLLVAPTGSRKSTEMRAAVVRYVTENPKKTVIILMPRHRLGDEQIEMLQREHPEEDYSAAIWRGRHAWDPHVGNGYEQQMCQRSEDAEAVEKALLDVESTLCKRGRGEKAVKCPFFDTCAYQQQKQIKANIWFAAHECAVHEMPKAFGDVGWIIFDESPLDAFMFGVDINDQVTLELDTLRIPMPIDQTILGGKGPEATYAQLQLGREEIYHALDKLPIEPQHGTAIPWEGLKPFITTALGGSIPWKSLEPITDIVLAGTNNCFLVEGGEARPHEKRNLTWRCKVDPKIRPDTPREQLKVKLQKAAFNATVKKEVTLWELIEAVGENKIHIRDIPVEQVKTMLQDAAVDGSIEREVPLWDLINIPIHRGVSYGRIQVQRGAEGRIIRMVGLRPLAKGWDVPTLICDATGDAELLKAIWPQLKAVGNWEQLPRPKSVRISQCVDRTNSKWAVAIEGKDSKDLERRIEGARRLYATMLMKALEYGGADVGIITYKSTRDWIERNYPVPEWIKLMHWGDLTGTNALQTVRALFVIGRAQASAEAVTRQAEALFGVHIPQRKYVDRLKKGRIPIVPHASGNNGILVNVREHPNPIAERLRRQITEGGIIQAAGRARAGLREADEPLDIHIWTDVPVPELGPVEPVLWGELETGLDGLMLAKGCWLKNIADAVRAFDGLFTIHGLEKARAAGRSRRGVEGGLLLLYIGDPICRRRSPALVRVIYQRNTTGCKPTEAIFLRGISDPRRLARGTAWSAGLF